MNYAVTVIADSISSSGIRLTTLEAKYPRYIHAEVLTHRVFSRNAASSRAIPVKRQLSANSEIVLPIRWGKNVPGMQAGEDLDPATAAECEAIWRDMADYVTKGVERLSALGLHKQWANRPTEWFSTIRTVLSSTDWANWTALRDHADAQPEILELAKLITAARQASTPRELGDGEWHLPYIDDAELAAYGGRTDPSGNLRMVSAARCARVSYKTHDGRTSSLDEDLDLCAKLIHTDLVHASPFEHQARPDVVTMRLSNGQVIWMHRKLHGNFRGWVQNRKTMANECVPEPYNGVE
jgi:hypothetical protein